MRVCGLRSAADSPDSQVTFRLLSNSAHVLFLILSLVFALLPSAPADGPPPTPVLVELFTSEGCSSCPPADSLLRELEARQPVPGVEVIPLGFHVDYWDDLGWKDRFSSPDYTRRQQEYRARFGLDSVYTPQMVVDGRVQFVGNDSAAAFDAIRRAARDPKPAIGLRRTSDGKLQIDVGRSPRRADVLLVITEGNLSTSVGAGENRGRSLRHTGVVRSLTRIGSTNDGRFQASVPLPSPSAGQELRAVVFLQRGIAGEVMAAASMPLR